MFEGFKNLILLEIHFRFLILSIAAIFIIYSQNLVLGTENETNLALQAEVDALTDKIELIKAMSE